MTNQYSSRKIQTIVIGGGQAGLAVGYHLAKRGISFQILDASRRIGDAWRNRWDSLRLFNPARYAGLPGLPFPARGDVFPTKDEVADYLESYAQHFHLPVQTGVKVDRLSKEGDGYVVSAGSQQFESNNVVVAMANYQVPRLPTFAPELDPGIVQMHSHEYRNPSQLRDGGVLIVGVGNSGADIGIEVARTHPTWMSGKETGHVPFRIESALWRFFLVRLLRFFGHHVLTVNTPLGRKLGPQLISRAAPLVRVKPQDLIDAGIERVSRVVGVQNGRPLLEGGRSLEVRNIIWCTGYHPGFSWIDLPIFGENGEPLHERGVVNRAPGMYFVGLHFLYSMTSATLLGIGRDAERVAKAIESRSLATRSQTPSVSARLKLPAAKLRSELMGADTSNGDAQIATVS
ncbi:MAG: NAD(P)/FAD-dependent oxidoreductase [Acidobacteriia bacterium]|jgi:putative flavoprotein involved in K+ transport|nr:NAD(P)/FAD-dependent oxidoreductase [Terriglobia bacterium]